jgi:hypothetical protein
MDKNLSWASSLGDAYYNQQQDVMDAVQVMRQRAQKADDLKSTPEQTVTTQGSTIIIQPASPDIVYVPAYNPWMAYGDPIVAWPGWYPYPGIWYGGPYLSFGSGFGIGFFDGFGWGWPHWGFDWHNRYPIYNRDRYYSRSRTFYNRNNFYRGAGGRAGFRHTKWSGWPPQPREQAIQWEHRRSRRSLQPSRRNPQAVQWKRPGGSRIRCAPRPERHPLGGIQRLRPWRTNKKLFLTW